MDAHGTWAPTGSSPHKKMQIAFLPSGSCERCLRRIRLPARHWRPVLIPTPLVHSPSPLGASPQGLANVACAAFGCLPATGALARTAANIRAGGRSPVSGLVHAVVVGAVILAAAPAAEYIPLPALSAVLVGGCVGERVCAACGEPV